MAAVANGSGIWVDEDRFGIMVAAVALMTVEKEYSSGLSQGKR
jgi:hypothetical protein